MKLLTKKIKDSTPKLYETDGVPFGEKVIHAKFFCPWNHWTWYATEFDGEDIFYGYVKGDHPEWGYFSLKEMESVNGPWGLKIERDMHFDPIMVSNCSELNWEEA